MSAYEIRGKIGDDLDELRRIVACGAIYEMCKSFECTVAYLAFVGEVDVPRTEAEFALLKESYWTWRASTEGHAVYENAMKTLGKEAGSMNEFEAALAEHAGETSAQGVTDSCFAAGWRAALEVVLRADGTWGSGGYYADLIAQGNDYYPPEYEPVGCSQ